MPPLQIVPEQLMPGEGSALQLACTLVDLQQRDLHLDQELRLDRMAGLYRVFWRLQVDGKLLGTFHSSKKEQDEAAVTTSIDWCTDQNRQRSQSRHYFWLRYELRDSVMITRGKLSVYPRKMRQMRQMTSNITAYKMNSFSFSNGTSFDSYP
jgi:hypothetical protein